MKVITFREIDHRYTTLDGKLYESVSGLWKPYIRPFDGFEVSTKKAFKDFDNDNYVKTKKKVKYHDPNFIDALFDNTEMDHKELKEIAKGFRDQWAAKREKGTAFHKLKEEEDIRRGYVINPFTNKEQDVILWDKCEGCDNQSFDGDLMNLEDGFIPEHLVSDDGSETAGQIDKNYIESIGKVRYVDLDDYKTDDEMTLKPTFKHPRTGYQKLKFPFDHIYETNYWKYVMKMSTYAKMLERQGFVVRNISLTKVTISDDLELLNEERFILPYKSFEADLILNMRKEKINA